MADNEKAGIAMAPVPGEWPVVTIEQELIRQLKEVQHENCPITELDLIVSWTAKVIYRLNRIERGSTYKNRYTAPESEAFLQLHRDLNRILANSWHEVPSDEIKRRIQHALAESMQIFI